MISNLIFFERSKQTKILVEEKFNRTAILEGPENIKG
jgi:hypothetical protein